MPKYFEVTPVRTELELDADGKGTVEFKIQNTTSHPVALKYRIGFPQKAGEAADKTASVSPKPDWFTLPSVKGEQLVPDQTQPCPVKIAVPAKTPPGTYQFTLTVANEAKPDEEWAESPRVSFKVPELKPAIKPPPPLWIFIVLGVVLLIGIGVGLYFAFRHQKVAGDPCASVNDCGKGLICVLPPVPAENDDAGTPSSGPQPAASAGSGQGAKPSPSDKAGGAAGAQGVCKVPVDTACAHDDECVTEKCVDKVCKFKDCATPCPKGQVCQSLVGAVAVGTAPSCVGATGFQGCTESAQCALGSCIERVCGAKECSGNAACDGPQVCNGKSCTLPTLRPCASADDCATGNCENDRCLFRKCSVTQACPSDQICDPQGRCAGKDDFKGCVGALDCHSGNCNQDHVCAKVDVGKPCTTGRACANKNLQCVDVRVGAGPLEGRCLLNPNQPCDEDQTCASGWCRNNRCWRLGLQCADLTECRPPSVGCYGGYCVAANGNQCESGAECQSGYCDPTAKKCSPPPVVYACPPCVPLRQFCNTSNGHCEPRLIRTYLDLRMMDAVPLKRP